MALPLPALVYARLEPVHMRLPSSAYGLQAIRSNART